VTVLEQVGIDQLVAPGILRPAYQPIFDLVSGDTVGFEALARWPGLEVRPDEAFELAAQAGRLAELDWACRLAAIEGALAAGLTRDVALFVNVEPSTLGRPGPRGSGAVLGKARERLRVVVELTERALLRRPAELLALVELVRSWGWGVALDDVGAVPDSLAMLPFVAPDVVKLDLSLVQRWPDATQGRIVAAVMAHAEHTGAVVLAEGIETERHLEQAIALGATVGQGWLFAAAGPLADPVVPAHPLPPAAVGLDVPESPFALVEGSPRLQTGRKGLLLGLSRHFEHRAASAPTPPLVFGAFERADRFTPATARRYEVLARRSPLVAVLGDDLGPRPAAGVRGMALGIDDPLRSEWSVVVVGPHYSGALIARDLGDDGPDLDRRFSFVVTHDRDTVVAAARSMLHRLGPA
jgi:EAL domain-containing protein (putative c-di-GMP-specific phosphodiesterase class I)